MDLCSTQAPLKHSKYTLTIFLCKSASFQESDFSVIIKIFFVPNEDDNNVWTGKGSGICQPVCKRVVRFTTVARIEYCNQFKE